MKQNNEFLGTAPVGRLLFRLGIPTIAAQLINMLYNVVDRIYIGHMPEVGDLALTGVGVCLPVIMIVSAFAYLISGGGAPRASIFLGQGDRDSAERTMGSCFSLQVVVSLILTAALLLWSEDMLLAFGASENTIGYAASYMKVYAAGTLFVQLTLGMNSYITAQGFTRVSMYTILIGAGLNIVLDPIFIYLLNLGVQGAALATVISQGVSCVWVVCFLCGKKTVLRLKRSTLPIRRKLVLPCVALGTAHFIMQASESLISVCFNASLLRCGGDVAVGAMTILSSVMQFALLPIQGLGQGAQPIISYNFGAQKPQRVRRTFRLLVIASVAYSTLLWACIQLFPQTFAGIFTSDSALLDFTAHAIRLYFGVLCIFGIQLACQTTFVALGNARSSILVAIMRKFILLLPLIYLMPALFPGDRTSAIYLAEPVADVLAVSFTVLLFRVQFKKALERIDTKPV